MIVRKLFTDGGLIKGNPSPVGGVWAWCEIQEEIDDDGVLTETICRSAEGWLSPANLLKETITSPNMEIYAVVEALEQIGDNQGEPSDDAYQRIVLHSDNSFAIGAVCHEWDTKTVPYVLCQRVDALKARIADGRLSVEGKLLGGHPNPEDLLRGIRMQEGKSQLPCSMWNVWCDDTCERLKKKLRIEFGINKAPAPKLPKKPKPDKPALKKATGRNKNGIPFVGMVPGGPARVIVVPALASASVKAEQMDMFAGAA